MSIVRQDDDENEVPDEEALERLLECLKGESFKRESLLEFREVLFTSQLNDEV